MVFALLFITQTPLCCTLEDFSTSQKIVNGDSRYLNEVESNTIDLVVTSPPYPMIEMWDDLFSSLDPEIFVALRDGNGDKAFSLMVRQLNLAWGEINRVTREGAVVCINIGDATRNLDNSYRLFPSHTTISDYFRKIGFEELPSIVWKKPSNSPNKFLGSGTLPVNAYVTLEHEYILIFRKGSKRKFSSSEAGWRQESAFFWEERNKWFSDIWGNLKGTRQKLQVNGTRDRSGAFPLELPLRLINMYSIKGDTVLDPFLGTGSTSIAAAASGRNSIGYEMDRELYIHSFETVKNSKMECNSIVDLRIEAHRQFVETESAEGREFSYFNKHHGFPVVTRNEVGIKLRKVDKVTPVEGSGEVMFTYS